MLAATHYPVSQPHICNGQPYTTSPHPANSTSGVTNSNGFRVTAIASSPLFAALWPLDSTLANARVKSLDQSGKLVTPRNVVIHYEVPNRRHAGAEEIRDKIVNIEFIDEQGQDGIVDD